MLSQIVQMVAEAQRSRAPIQRWPIRSPAGSCPLVIAVACSPSSPGRSGVPSRASPRPGRGGLGADHRLSLRARAGDADVDHGRRRPRRAGRRPDQERRGARADGEGRHAGRRQDRHADRGRPAVTVIVPARASPSEVPAAAASVERASEHPLALAIVRGRRTGISPFPPVADFDSPTGKGALGTVEGKSSSAMPASSPSRASTAARR
jgi:Cu+-exporting ATPase